MQEATELEYEFSSSLYYSKVDVYFHSLAGNEKESLLGMFRLEYTVLN